MYASGEVRLAVLAIAALSLDDRRVVTQQPVPTNLQVHNRNIPEKQKRRAVLYDRSSERTKTKDK
jgi:hypothetical protein